MTTTEAPITTDTGSDTAGTSDDAARAAELNGRLFMACLGALELATVALGDRLGLYRVLAERGPSTATELAGAAAARPGSDQPGGCVAHHLRTTEPRPGAACPGDTHGDRPDQRVLVPPALSRRRHCARA